ncbi:MAG: YggS family pyridoxal phosphate-dependent enzyme [Firmicutes bacterium]|nr:YggS family pyridoxal phosphate-dependent enzyme [Bacillota bacterium]
MGVRENLQTVGDRILTAARRAGRDPEKIKIIAVSKQVPVESIKEVLGAGITDLGENRVQEMTSKMDQLPSGLRWHMIGHLQTNKVKYVVGEVALIHSLDRWDLARAIEQRADALNVVVPVLVQVNVSGEKSKFGLRPGELADFLAALQDFRRIKVKGLMTMAPYADDPEEARPFFRELRQLAGRLAVSLPGVSLEHLSMGMTNDFEVAVEEGADLLRLGTAVFGARTY